MNLQITCDKCDSDQVDVFFHPDSFKKPRTITMSQWAGEGNVHMEPAVYIMRREVAQCRACGHRVECTV